MTAPTDALRSDSAFHRGEREAQTRVGVREQLEAVGDRVVRDAMPEQHRELFGKLPFIVVGAVDAARQPWASMLAAAPGFITSPDAQTLRIDALPLHGDPIAAFLEPGADVALLGIELETRRRNRANGRIVAVDARGFTVHVAQSFGNCPKYIQKRAYTLVGRDQAAMTAPRVQNTLNASAAAMIRNADTFFIATHYAAPDERPAHGADVSHRGGKPGFVRIDDERTLTWPDFTGNFYFNTLGNLLVNPRAGLLFPGFDNGDLLYLSGRAEIIWDGDEVKTYAGAQRLLRFGIERVVHLERVLPLRWRFEDYSPVLERTGSWE